VGGIGVLLLAGLVGTAWLLADRGATTDPTSTTTAPTEPVTAPPTTVAGAAELVAPPAGRSITGTTPCPKEDGSETRATSFEQAPPSCIDTKASYTATFDTTMGTFTAKLDPAASPVGVNNFVVLSRYKFYDGIPFHRIAPDFAIQAGDPVGEPWGTHGPGYTIEEEPPADLKYSKYDLAMANTSQPNSTGSQFFIATGDTTALDTSPTYTYLGQVVEGKDVVDKINAVKTVGASGDTPGEAVVINSVTISE
jgi:cyclophilin family peptidyl-prolyl cis-trans isomerase